MVDAIFRNRKSEDGSPHPRRGGESTHKAS